MAVFFCHFWPSRLVPVQAFGGEGGEAGYVPSRRVCMMRVWDVEAGGGQQGWGRGKRVSGARLASGAPRRDEEL